jgi:hypothetical protein
MRDVETILCTDTLGLLSSFLLLIVVSVSASVQRYSLVIFLRFPCHNWHDVMRGNVYFTVLLSIKTYCGIVDVCTITFY